MRWRSSARRLNHNGYGCDLTRWQTALLPTQATRREQVAFGVATKHVYSYWIPRLPNDLRGARCHALEPKYVNVYALAQEKRKQDMHLFY